MNEKEITVLLEEVQDDKNHTNAAQKAKSFYDNNLQLCMDAHDYYNGYRQFLDNYVCSPIEIDIKDLQRTIEGDVILVLTSNDIEEGIILRFFSEHIKKPIPSFTVKKLGSQVYHIISMKRYTIVHAHTERTGDEFMRRTINQSSRIFSITYIVLLGICYGIDHNKQEMCSVIIADDVRGYRVNFIDDFNGKTAFQPEIEFEEKPEESMIQSIKSFIRYSVIGRHILSHGKAENIIIKVGKVLSANCLISSEQVKKAVVESVGDKKHRPLGGEMEACGIFKSNIFEEYNHRKWLLIKSICDWGAGKNSLCPNDLSKGEQIKDSLQALAMINSCEVFLWLLDTKIYK